MAYLITTTDGTPLGTILPQTINSSFSSITLIGEALMHYGQYLNDDLIALTENFANSTSPPNPLKGQLWYNKETDVISSYDGVNWDVLASQTWVQDNFTPSSANTNFTTQITNIIASCGLNSNGTKPNYLSNNYILNSDSLEAAIGKLDTALAGSDTEASYLTISAAEAEYAPLISASLSGTPTAPTPSGTDNSTKIATTAFVAGNFLNTTTAASTYLSQANAATEYATLNSPGLTGTPTAPTPSISDSSTKLATTAYVQENFTSYNSTLASYLYGNYLTISGAESEYAPLVSPNLVGVPTAPTPATNDNSTTIATTAFVQSALAGGLASSFGASGYQKLPGGLIIQWGVGTIPGPNALSVTFPITFPNACLTGVVSTHGSLTQLATVDGFTTTQITMDNSDGSASLNVYWIAMGY